MASLQFVAAVFVLTTGLAQAAPSKTLPPGVNTCAADDPELNACFIRNANKAIPILAAGVPSLKLIKFDPLHVDEFHIDDSNSPRQVALDLTLKQADFIGLSGMTLTDASIDLKGNSMYYSGYVPRLEIVGGYKIAGRVLILPIVGDGAINITQLNIKFSMKYALNHDVSKTGVEMFRAKNSTLDFDTEQAFIRLDNLFNGDKRLGDNMNVFLNENWKELVKDIGGPIAEVVNMAAFQIVSRIFSLYPANQIFT